MKNDDYIYAQKAEREKTAIYRLIADGGSSLSNVFNEQLHLAFPWCWIGIRIPQRILLEGLQLSENEFIGDIDFFGGNLQPNSQERFLQYVEEFSNEESHPSWAYKIAQYQTLFQGEIK